MHTLPGGQSESLFIHVPVGVPLTHTGSDEPQWVVLQTMEYAEPAQNPHVPPHAESQATPPLAQVGVVPSVVVVVVLGEVVVTLKMFVVVVVLIVVVVVARQTPAPDAAMGTHVNPGQQHGLVSSESPTHCPPSGEQHSPFVHGILYVQGAVGPQPSPHSAGAAHVPVGLAGRSSPATLALTHAAAAACLKALQVLLQVLPALPFGQMCSQF